MALVRNYSLYDSVAKQHVRMITSQSDATAERSLEYIVRDGKFDKIVGKDLILVHCFDFNTETGKVENNDVRTISALATVMAKVEAEKMLETQVKLVEESVNGKGSRKGSGKAKEGKKA